MDWNRDEYSNRVNFRSKVASSTRYYISLDYCVDKELETVYKLPILVNRINESSLRAVLPTLVALPMDRA